MTKTSNFNVSVELVVPVLLEIETDTADRAIAKFYQIPLQELLHFGVTEEDALGIVDGSVHVE
jgi:hypothetical protein